MFSKRISLKKVPVGVRTKSTMHYFDRILTWRKIVVLRAVFFFFICGFPAHRFIGFYTTFLYQNAIFWTFKNSYRAASPDVLSYHLELLSCCLEFLSYRLEFLSYRLQSLSLNSTDNRKLERVQERALRKYNRKSWTYDELLKLAKLPALKKKKKKQATTRNCYSYVSSKGIMGFKILLMDWR